MFGIPERCIHPHTLFELCLDVGCTTAAWALWQSVGRMQAEVEWWRGGWIPRAAGAAPRFNSYGCTRSFIFNDCFEIPGGNLWVGSARRAIKSCRLSARVLLKFNVSVAAWAGVKLISEWRTERYAIKISVSRNYLHQFGNENVSLFFFPLFFIFFHHSKELLNYLQIHE